MPSYARKEIVCETEVEMFTPTPAVSDVPSFVARTP